MGSGSNWIYLHVPCIAYTQIWIIIEFVIESIFHIENPDRYILRLAITPSSIQACLISPFEFVFLLSFVFVFASASAFVFVSIIQSQTEMFSGWPVPVHTPRPRPAYFLPLPGHWPPPSLWLNTAKWNIMKVKVKAKLRLTMLNFSLSLSHWPPPSLYKNSIMQNAYFLNDTASLLLK